MDVIHKFSEFSKKQRENKTCVTSKYVYHPNIYNILTEIDQIPDILPISCVFITCLHGNDEKDQENQFRK